MGGGAGVAGVAGVAGAKPEPQHVCATAALEATATTSFLQAARCLFEGSNPPQKGVAKDTIDPERVAIVRGRIADSAQKPLAGVRVTVQRHQEFGETVTDARGEYALAVNGGEELVLKFGKSGLLGVQRQRRTDWQRFTVFPDVVLIAESTLATAVDLTTATAPVLAVGSEVSDTNGKRTQAVLIRPGTKVTLALPSGTKKELTEFHLRSTEYTVGAPGPGAMPGDLPTAVGYTYAAEFTLDEARAAGATQVSFEPAVITYVDNFLTFPAGTMVPAGYYDPDRSVWVAGPSGLVVDVIAVEGGAAVLDVTGDGNADDAATLTSLGIDASELTTLAARYKAGSSLWRVPLEHFSPWDFNWGFGPPADAEVPNLDVDGADSDDCQTKAGGSIIGCESQTLGEAVAVPGSPISLHYQSERMPGRRDSHALTIQLSGATLPPSVKSILLEVEVLGKVTQKAYAPAPNLSDEFDWDGTDAWGRTWQGRQLATVRVGYVYDGSYERTNRFGTPPSGAVITGSRTRQEVTLWRKWEGFVGGLDAGVMGLGGWTVDVHHLYDPRSKVLYLGNGEKRSADAIGSTVTTVVGTGAEGYSGDNGPALEAEITQPHGVVVAPNGTVYISDDLNHVIRRVTPDGTITTIAGTGEAGFAGDGGPATAAAFNTPMGLALAHDGTLYVADADNGRIRAIAGDGTIRTLAGGGTTPLSETTSVPAAVAQLKRPHSLVLLSDGTLLAADDADSLIYSVAVDGSVSIVAGGGTTTDEGAQALETRIGTPVGLAVSPTGDIYYTEWDAHRVRRVDPAGRVWTIAGTGNSGFSGDRGPGTLANLNQPHTVELGPEGSVYITDEGNRRIRRVGPDGYIDTVAGTGMSAGASNGDNGPPLSATFSQPRIVYRHKDGSLWVGDYTDNRVRRLRPSLPGYSSGETVLASSDAAEMYVFDSMGRHLRTLDAITRVPLWTFGYDTAHRLVSLTDRDGNQTTLARDTNGTPKAIVGPFGAQAKLSFLPGGYLGSVTDALERVTAFTYLGGGLLETLTEPDNGQSGVHKFTYDSAGRLLKDESPTGLIQTLTRKSLDTGTEVALSSTLGRSRVHRLEPGANESLVRTVSAPDGTKVTTASAPGQNTVTLSTGTTVKQIVTGDPRFGLQSPVVASTELTSGTLPIMTVTRARTVEMTDTTDPTSVTRLVDTAGVNGRSAKTEYSVALRTAVSTTPMGRKVTSTWDEKGRVISTEAAGVLPTTFGYDAKGRLITVTAGEHTTTFAYDTNGYLSSTTDPIGRVVTRSNDAIGRSLGVTLPDKLVLGFGYDAHDNPSSITTAAQTAHEFGHLPGDLLGSYVPPSVGTAAASISFGYDADAQLTSITLPDKAQLSLDYDKVSGRLVATTLPGTEGTVALTYDATTGQLTSQNLGGETVTITYNGELVAGFSYVGPVAGTVAFEYDKNHWLVSERINTEVAIAYAYDDDGLVTAAGSETITRSADNGAITATALANIGESYGYSPYGELASYTATNQGTALYSLTATRDALGRIAQLTEQLGTEKHVDDYAYHKRGWLETVRRDGAALAAYAYDANGSRTSVTSAGIAAAATYDAMDRVVSHGGNSYGYAPNGELSTKTAGGGTTSYRHNALGALTNVTLPSGKQIEYVTDATGRRIGKRVDGVLVRGWLYRNPLHPVAELDASSKVTSLFVYGARVTTPDYLVRGSVAYRIISDWRGSVRLVVNATTGEVAQRIDYDAFGQVTSDSNPGFQPFGFSGGLYDADTKLVRFGARDYDPEVGRWTNRDPILFDGGQTNLYVYAGNDPVNYVDPDGQWAFLVPMGIGAVTGGGLDLGLQLATNGWNLDCVNWGQVGASAALGAAFSGAGHAIKVLRSASSYAARGGGYVVGRTVDLAKPGALRTGEKTLPVTIGATDKATWASNRSVLRMAMREGKPIRDASLGKSSQFLDAERALLKHRGWKLEGEFWVP